jgi:hypothetical protein
VGRFLCYECLLLALSGHWNGGEECLLSGGKADVSSGFHVTQKVDMVQLIDGDPEHAG